MVWLIATWDGEQIVYVVIVDNESRPFPGEDSFSLAWAFAQEKTHERRRRLTEAEAKARVEEANLIEGQSRITSHRLGLDLLDNPEAPYWLFEEDYTVLRSRIPLVDDAVQLSAAALSM